MYQQEKPVYLKANKVHRFRGIRTLEAMDI